MKKKIKIINKKKINKKKDKKDKKEKKNKKDEKIKGIYGVIAHEMKTPLNVMKLYNEAGVATYTELILGLPGETYQSLVDGIDKLLVLGQHNSIYIHNCEWLPCSIMGQKDYVERYDIKTSRIPLNQPHREPDEWDDIPEWSQVVTSTYSMNEEEWKKMNLFYRFNDKTSAYP